MCHVLLEGTTTVRAVVDSGWVCSFIVLVAISTPASAQGSTLVDMAVVLLPDPGSGLRKFSTDGPVPPGCSQQEVPSLALGVFL